MARRPTCPKLRVRGLSGDSNSDGSVRVVAIRALARLAWAVRAETPPSFDAVFALDVEARPHKPSQTVCNRTRTAKGIKPVTRNMRACVPWPLHRAISVRAFDWAEAAQNAILVHAFVSNVTGTEEGPGAFVLL